MSNVKMEERNSEALIHHIDCGSHYVSDAYYRAPGITDSGCSQKTSPSGKYMYGIILCSDFEKVVKPL